MSLFAELRRRNVLRAGALYVAGAWALAQGVAQLLPARLRFDPTLEGLREDPRFAALVRQMQFPE